MYECEIWPLNSVNIREIDIIWNNGFDVFLTAAGEKALNCSSFIVELPRCPLLRCPPLFLCAALSTPALSTLASLCYIVHSCIVHP